MIKCNSIYKRSYKVLNSLSCISSLSTIIVPNRIFYRISGVDSRKFLQGICTNDVNKLDKHGDCIAAAFLTPGGRIVADALLYNVENNIIIETHSSLGNSLDRYLRVYKLRSKVTIETLELKCLLEISDISTKDLQELVKSHGAMVGAIDPRTNEMGTRFLVPKGKGNDDKSKSLELWYDRFRLTRGIAEGPPIVDRIPLECNLDLLNYISFSKGCYVGQELTARTKYKGLVRKRLIPFTTTSSSMNNSPFHPIDEQYLAESKKDTAIDDTSANSNVNANDRIFLSIDGIVQGNIDKASSIGEVVDTSSGVGVAMMRLTNILTKETTNTQFVTSTNQGINTFRPSWFPTIDPVTGKAMDDHLKDEKQ